MNWLYNTFIICPVITLFSFTSYGCMSSAHVLAEGLEDHPFNSLLSVYKKCFMCCKACIYQCFALIVLFYIHNYTNLLIILAHVYNIIYTPHVLLFFVFFTQVWNITSRINSHFMYLHYAVAQHKKSQVRNTPGSNTVLSCIISYSTLYLSPHHWGTTSNSLFPSI